MSPQLKLILQGLLYVLEPLAQRTQTTFDDMLVTFLKLAISNPAAAHAQLAAGAAAHAAALESASKAQTQAPGEPAGESDAGKGKKK